MSLPIPDRLAVIVPTNRPAKIEGFAQAWELELNQPYIRVIVVEDSEFGNAKLPGWLERYTWQDIDRDLGAAARCIPRRSGSVRDYGFWKACQDASIGYLATLDDDVEPVEAGDAEGLRWANSHLSALSADLPLDAWPTWPGFRLRGQPYRARLAPVMLNHGLWRGVPDLDAVTQLSAERQANDAGLLADWNSALTVGPADSWAIPTGYRFAYCGMNVAWRREVAPYYWLPRLPDGYKRWDDIWAGLVFKRLADGSGWLTTSGRPHVRHARASSPIANLQQEMCGYGLNERLWEELSEVRVWADNRRASFVNLWERLSNLDPALADLGDLADQWLRLWPQP